jgi:indolepyruvate ferredoxin oxidoreductase beta subunit
MSNNEVKNILLVGVGGQGTILVSKIITSGLIEAGYDVKMSEIHGMAQRGGSVSTQIRFGKKVYSPIIEKGKVDIMVAFETMEAYRWLEYLNSKTVAIINDFEIPSVPILNGQKNYPKGLLKDISRKIDIKSIKAGDTAEEIGNIRTMNIVLLGALVKILKMEKIDWEKAMKDNIKAKMIDINLKAFKAGNDLVN